MILHFFFVSFINSFAVSLSWVTNEVKYKHPHVHVVDSIDYLFFLPLAIILCKITIKYDDYINVTNDKTKHNRLRMFYEIYL